MVSGSGSPWSFSTWGSTIVACFRATCLPKHNLLELVSSQFGNGECVWLSVGLCSNGAATRARFWGRIRISKMHSWWWALNVYKMPQASGYMVCRRSLKNVLVGLRGVWVGGVGWVLIQGGVSMFSGRGCFVWCHVYARLSGFHGRLLAAATLHKKLRLYTVLKAMSKKVEFSRQRARRPECVHTEICRYKG